MQLAIRPLLPALAILALALRIVNRTTSVALTGADIVAFYCQLAAVTSLSLRATEDECGAGGGDECGGDELHGVSSERCLSVVVYAYSFM